MKFLEELCQQRWDDHRYYHHNRVNQFLHLLSAMCFLTSYYLLFVDPVKAVMVGWLLAMMLRQTGHFFFEPKTYDEVNNVSNEYKESIKVGYNLHRKVILLSIWFLAPLILLIDSSFFGLFEKAETLSMYLYNTSIIWLAIGVGAVLFRTVHLFFIMGLQSGCVWFSKILTDPIHDILIYYKSPYYLFKGEMYDEMTDWKESASLSHKNK